MKKFFKSKKSIFCFVIIVIVLYNGFKTPAPEGTNFVGRENEDVDVEFLYDLTYQNNNQVVMEQEILDKYLSIIDNAEDFIIIDMFLFNDDYNREYSYKNVSETVTNKLIEKKKANKDLDIVFITDEINNFYGSYEHKFLTQKKANGIDVVVTDLNQVRDSNPLYAGVWRTFFKWINTEGEGYLPNVFSPDSKKVTLPAYLKLLNFKADHRKVLISEKMAMVSSANNHDASANHSNMAFVIKDNNTIDDLITAEKTVAKFSGYEFKDEYKANVGEITQTDMKVQVLSEKAILDALLSEIKDTEKGDEINMAMFYIGHREVIKELINASNRGVLVNLVLDPSKDAFGVQKSGIPNRQVASELKKKSNINIKWYDTNGEQFHSKMTAFNKKDEFVVIGGSANYTRRNLDSYNLELSVKVTAETDSILKNEIDDYFERILNNEDGIYTTDYSTYEDNSLFKKLVYRFQELTGLSTF